MRRLTAEDYAVDAVTMAKALVGAWLCRRLDDGTVIRRRITETEAYCGEEDTAAPRIGIAYASKRGQDRKWRFAHKKDIIISLYPSSHSSLSQMFLYGNIDG